MKSPFPGMDPYIEACGLWEDFHNHLVEEIAKSLAMAVPEKYLVRTGERAYVVVTESEGEKRHLFKPDVRVTSGPNGGPNGETKSPVAIVPSATDAESIPMRAFVTEEFREGFIEIHAEEAEQRLVTCIELLSPSNKRPGTEGWTIYQRKRQGLLLGQANFVEIDLLQGGHRMPMLDPWPASPYTLLVARRFTAPSCRVWPAHYNRPLPPIPVPLLHPDPAVSLNLQPLIEGIYSWFHYDRSIDYAKSLNPPLTPDESTWLESQLRQRRQSS